MVKRIDVSTVQNVWHDAQNVDKTDMDVEQNFVNQTTSAIVNNFMGSGVLLENPSQPVLFDSDNLTYDQQLILGADNFDGIGLQPHAQPSDSNLGNQIEIELTGSTAIGRISSKVVIIGLSFDNELQQDRFYFYKNEKQCTSKHYKHILTIMFNDFKGNNNCSRNLGGRFVIRETSSFELSRDAKVVAQDVQPDIFWRDFKVADRHVTLFNTIQQAIGADYDADDLHINITGRQPHRTLVANDVTTRLGQKFLATTDNIQKVTFLAGVEKDGYQSTDHWFDWAGDLILSIYPLQTTVNCPTQIIPELKIDFDPSQQPLVEVSFSQAELLDLGYILTDIAQPVDFVFSNSSISIPGAVIPGEYYAVVLKRSGAATSGTIFFETGNDWLANSRLTIYSGGVWTDVSDEDMWFQIWSDAAKVADGQGYDAGKGMMYEKTIIDSSTGAAIDNEINNQSFANVSPNVVNTGVLQAQIVESITVQDERTGNNVFSRQQYEPEFSFVTSANLATLKSVSDPIVIGCAMDINPKVTDFISGVQTFPGLAKTDEFTIINPDPDLLSINLIGRKIIPNNNNTIAYKVMGISLCTDGYGDTNGDGYINLEDLTRAIELLGEDLSTPTTQQRIVDGYLTTLEFLRADVDGDGIITSNDVDLIQDYINRVSNSFPVGVSFSHLTLTLQNQIGRYDGYHDCGDGYVRIDGNVGTNIVDVSSLTLTQQHYYGYPLDVSLEGSDSEWSAVPYVDLTYEIEWQPFWQDYLVPVSSEARQLPAAFTYDTRAQQLSCNTSVTYSCQNRNELTPSCDPGRNDIFVPANFIIGNGGQILRPNGDFYKPDIEIGTVILQLPETPMTEAIIDVFHDFVADRGDGFTNAGYSAMRYSDCSTVQAEDLTLNRIRFSVAIQSISKNLDGYSVDDGYGGIIDPDISVYIDPLTGMLKLTAYDLEVSPVYVTLISKVQIQVYLKKSGFNNQVLTVTPDEVLGLLI